MFQKWYLLWVWNSVIVLLSMCIFSSSNFSSLIILTKSKIIMFIFENQLLYCSFHLSAILYTKSYCIYIQFVFIRKKCMLVCTAFCKYNFLLFSKLVFKWRKHINTKCLVSANRLKCRLEEYTHKLRWKDWQADCVQCFM